MDVQVCVFVCVCVLACVCVFVRACMCASVGACVRGSVPGQLMVVHVVRVYCGLSSVYHKFISIYLCPFYCSVYVSLCLSSSV